MSYCLLLPEHRELMNQLYLQRDFFPQEICDELKPKFGVSLRSAQLRQIISRSGLAEKRRQLNREVTSIVSAAAITELAKSRAAGPEELMRQWAEALAGIVQKSPEAASGAERARDLASATSAAATAIRVFRNCSGLDAQDQPPKTAYTFNFASTRIEEDPRPDGLPPVIDPQRIRAGPVPEKDAVARALKKSETLSCRLTVAEKESIRAAASSYGMAITEYLVKCHEVVGAAKEDQQ
jgi:hypothetical protein